MKTLETLASGLAIGVCLLASPQLTADVYKWVDENGIVHYSDQPPEDRPGTEMPVQTMPERGSRPKTDESGESAGSPTWYDQWLAEQRERKRLEREERQQHSAERGALQAHMLEVCAEARQRLEVLETPCRAFFDGRGVLRSWCPNQATWVYRGEFRFVEDDERADMIRHYREQREACEAAGY